MARRTKMLTMSAALVALMVVMMWLGSFIEVLDLVILFAASLCLVFSVIEFGGAWPWLTYAATAVIGALLLHNKVVVVEFALIVGLLPMLKNYFERLPLWLGTLLKFVVFNAQFALTLVLCYLVLDVPFQDVDLKLFVIPKLAVPFTLAVLGNLCFLCYDILLTRMITLYYMKYRSRVRRWLRL